MSFFERGLSVTRHLIGRLDTEVKPSSETIMTFTGDKEVVRNIVNKTNETRIVVLFLGGGQAGVVGAGVADTINKLRLVDNIDTYIGLSSGSAAPYGLLGGCVDKIKDIYYQENIEYELFKWSRLGNLFARDILEEVLREKAVNHSFLQSRKPNFFIGLTHAEKGLGRFFDVKKYHDPLRLIMASMNMPWAHRAGPIEIDGEAYWDGGLIYPNPIKEIARTFNPLPTDILVIDPLPFDKFSTEPENLAYLLSSFGFKNPCIELLKTRRLRYLRELPFITGKQKVFNKNGEQVRVAAIHPNETPLTMFTMNPKMLQQGMIAAEEFANKLFSQA